MSELLEKDLSNVVFQCIGIVFYNKLSWFVSELPEEDISNVAVQVQVAIVGSILQISCHGLCLK